MNIRKWGIRIGVSVAVLGIAAAVSVKLYFGSSEELEKWIGRQIVGIVNTFLVPQLSFTDLKYSAPASVDMTGVALTAPDGTKVLELEGFDIALAEAPSLGRPVVIERVVIDRGTVNLIRDETSGGLRGLSPIAKTADVNAPIQPGDTAEKSEPFRLSDVLRLRLIDLRDVGLRYDPGGGKPPMKIDGISTQLKIDPGGAGGEAGWYNLDFKIARGQIFQLGVRGRLNLDTRLAEVEECRLAVRVGPESISSLPSELQEILKRYEAGGELDLRVSGRVPLSDPTAGMVSLRAELKGFGLTLGKQRIVVDSLVAECGLADRKAELKSLVCRTLKGEIAAKARVDLAAASLPATLEWTIKELEIGELHKDAAASQQDVVGKLSSAGTAQAALSALPGSLVGSGGVNLRDARLVGLPLVSGLVDLLKIKLPTAIAATDKADVAFTFTAPGVRISRMDIITTLVAARGEGLVGYDGRLDMRLNAGPIEKLESLLGKAGELLGKLTDKLVAYKVDGVVGAPIIRVMVLEQKLGG